MKRLDPAFVRSVAAALAALPVATTAGSAATPRDELHTQAARVIAIVDDRQQQSIAAALWPRDATAPVALHDPSSGRTVVLDVERPGTERTRDVALPAGLPPANTCITLDGRRTALLVLPLPPERDVLSRLVWHERWHCIQDGLGFASREADNGHLDSEPGRVWLRLEMRALARALREKHEETAREHARAAIAFRARRGADGMPTSAEAALELNEGLAEYTGRRIAAAGRDDSAAIADALARGERAASHVRSFAYLTGPAYGGLLDRWRPGWRREIGAERDLPRLLARALAVEADADGSDAAAARYGAASVRDEERRVAREREARATALRMRFVDGAVLELALRGPSISFDPNSLFRLGAHGTFYAPLTLGDAWGELVAETGGLLASDWRSARVPAESVRGCGRHWQAADWRLTLEPGWRLVRSGKNWRVEEGDGPACP